MLAVVRECGFVEGFPHDIDLLFEEFAIGVLVDDGVAEYFDFSGVVAASDSEAYASVCDDICCGVVFGEAEGVPTWG